MSRALTARQIARRCVSLLLRPTAAAEGYVPPSQCPQFALHTLCELDRSWLPLCVARGSFATSTSHQRGFATASGGNLTPPSSEASPVSKTATHSDRAEHTPIQADDSKQQRERKQSKSAGGSHDTAPVSAARNDGVRRSRQPRKQVQTGMGAGAGVSTAGASQRFEGPQSPGQGANSSDGGNGSHSSSLVVPDHGPENDMDAFLAAWDPLMAEEDLSMDAIFELLDTHLGDDVQGLPSAQDILDAGDVDELREKDVRRKREEALKQEFAAKRIRVVDELGRSYATGKRKRSIARVWVMPGVGKFRVNSRSMTEYFPALVRRMDVLKPFQVSGTLGHFDVMSTVKGGGNTGQAQALRHGIARALQLFNPALRPVLKTEGLLTRDSRVVERKKPGLAKARKAFQWVKR